MSDGGGLFGEVLARGRVRAATTDAAWLQAMLDVEAALACAQAAAGVISPRHADVIAAACRADLYDVDAIGAEAAAVGNPAAPLVSALRARSSRCSTTSARRRRPPRGWPTSTAPRSWPGARCSSRPCPSPSA